MMEVSMDKDVLFNSAIADLEILEFKAGGNTYGINLSDVQEILPYRQKPTSVPNSHPFIEGFLMPRDILLSVVNFTASLKLEDIDDNKNEMLIVTNVENMNIAFHVDSVAGIHRVLVEDIKKPGKKLSTNFKECVIGVVTKEDVKIELVDTRTIIRFINPAIKLA